MKLLFCQRNLLMQRDMEETFQRMGIFFRCASYVFSNTDSDDYFCSHLRHFLTEDCYDAVFSFNFIPLIADVCHEMNVPYISWCYDAGWEFKRLDALFYDTNYVFHFDRHACEAYQSYGYPHVFHLPLAVNCNRLDALPCTPDILLQYRSDISFVGSLYEQYTQSLPSIFRTLNPQEQTALLNYIDNQSEFYTDHALWDVLNPDVVPDVLTRLALIAACSGIIAGRQRKVMLERVSHEFPLTLYTTSSADILPKADYRWRASYYSQMPFIFRHSTINLNLTIPSIQSGLPLRILDVLGSGGFLLTNPQPELSDYFTLGKDLDTFSSLDELCEKLSFYTAHPDIASRLAANGHAVVKDAFSFEQQFQKIAKISGLPL